MHAIPRLILVLAAASPLAAQMASSDPVDGPPLPRNLTPEEAAYIAVNPITVNQRAVTPPPERPLECVAEYEPMDGIIIAWEGFSSTLSALAANITTLGDADIYVAVDSASEGNSARNAIIAAGGVASRIHTMVTSTNTVWIRDYGPRYVYQGDVRAIIDHTYNRPRPQDNQFPTFFSGYMDHERYEIPLIHGGGNFHLNALDKGWATELIDNENPSLSKQQIRTHWWNYQRLTTSITDPLPSSVDSTQHIDMWMMWLDDDVVLISDWPLASGSTQDNVCDARAALLTSQGYTVHRIPAVTSGWTHYTFTNMVICNDLILLPSYTNSTASPYNSTALATVQAAAPGKTVVQVNGQDVVTSAGVFHCIVMHLPAHRGGVNPTAHLIEPRGGDWLQPGSTATIKWLSDDDEDVTAVDLLLSTDGGQTFPTTIASGLGARGTYNWTVPSLDVSNARVRVVAHDGAGNSGSDESSSDVVISATCYASVHGYGYGCSGTGGIPQLSATTPPVLGSLMTLEITQGQPIGNAHLIWGLSPSKKWFQTTEILVNYLADLPFLLDGVGEAQIPLTIPNNVVLVGIPVYAQTWIQGDPQGECGGYAATNGLALRFGY